MVRPEDYLLLMFSMKGLGKRVDLKHVQEKISRDLKKFSEEETKKILESMIKEGLLEEVKGMYGITKEGKEFFAQRLKEIEDELRKVNEPWVIVYKAKQYYPFVADTVFEFCKDRYVGFYCLHPQTPILTPFGFVPISNIKVGDKVYALNGNNFQPSLVTHTFCREVKEKVLIIKPYHLHPILITKNHPILTRYGYYKHLTLPRACKSCGKPVEKKKANYCRECSTKRRKEYKRKYLRWYFGRSEEDPRRKRESFGQERKFVKLLSKPEWISAEELYKRWVAHKKTSSVWEKLIPHVAFPVPQTVRDIPKLTSEHCEFLGYYAAEGYTLPYYVVIEISAKARQLAERIYEICEKLFPNAHLYERIDKRDKSRYLRISINSKKIAEFIRKLCPGNARTKEFNPAIMWLPPEKQMSILQAFLKGDGCITQTKGFTTINYGSTTSLFLALQLQLMLFRNKIFAGITSEAISSGRGPGRCYFLNYYNPSITIGRFSVFEKNILWVPIFSIRTHTYQGKVLNLEVKDVQNYLTPAGLVHNCLFTEKRFFRRDFKGKKIVLKSPKDLLFFVNIHYIDVIPCIHRIGMERPDWLVVDIDAGPKVSWEDTKQVTEVAFKILEKLDLNPALKFSGSRGFQIWSWVKEFSLPEKYEPLALRGETKREKNYFSLFADFVRVIQKEIDGELPNLTTSDVGLKETREEKVLIDPSIMKPMGLTRSPYATHSKTGLVSIPLQLKELKKFERHDATTEKVIERYKKKGNEFLLKPSDPTKLIEVLIS